MAWHPTFNLYESDGVTPVYTFDKVASIDDFQDPSEYIEHKSLRGIGSIIIPDSNTQGVNGNASWDMNISFYLIDTDYENLVAQIESLGTTIKKFTKYVLKVDLTQGGSTKDYKVMRLESIEFPLSSNKKRVTLQLCNLIFKVNAWQ